MIPVDKRNNIEPSSLDTGYVMRCVGAGRDRTTSAHYGVYQLARIGSDDRLVLVPYLTEEDLEDLAQEISKLHETRDEKFYNNLSLDRPSWFPRVDLRDRAVNISFRELNPEDKRRLNNLLTSP